MFGGMWKAEGERWNNNNVAFIAVYVFSYDPSIADDPKIVYNTWYTPE